MKHSSLIPAALAILAITSGASSAAVIYSGPQNVSVTNSFTSVYIDVDALVAQSSETPGWDVDVFFGGEAFGNSPSFQPVRQTIANNSAIVRLYFGDVVDSTDIYASTAAGSTTHIGGSADQFASGADGYLGFRLIDNSSVGPYYGWMKVNFSNTGDMGTIIEWAYDNTGSGISVGAIPEPATYSLLGIATVAWVLRRRRS